MIKPLPNLLIVDDNDSNLALLEIILGKLKVNLIKAESGFEALDKSNGQELALAILDIQMAGMNGYELAVKINEERDSNKAPIIFVTANHVYESDVFRGYDSGAVDYILKPINRHILLSKVNIFLDLFNQKQTIIKEAKILEKTTNELIWVNAALKRSEEKYRTMLNASPDGILLINLQGIITEVSEIGLELFDADNRDDLVGKDFYSFIPSEEANTVKDIFEKTVSEGLYQNVELKIRKKNQSTFFSEISSTLIQAPDGEPLSFMIIIRDISQRKKIETKQIHADRMANLGEMASGIAHEINQPLNIISMVMDKILFEADKTETINLEFLKTKSDKIFDNITRIRNIIDHVRAFSRNDGNYVSTAFDINLSIENAISMIMEQFKHLNINLKTQFNPQIPQIIGNTYKFEQVIVNLLTNAKDAVLERRRKQEDYCELKVEIRTYLENQSLIIEITDNGTGIHKDDIHNIMLPFYTTKEEGKGTGLGLSICYQIIKEMNGIIDISSDGINGTKITLVLDIQ